jgi:hypothetical protein
MKCLFVAKRLRAASGRVAEESVIGMLRASAAENG